MVITQALSKLHPIDVLVVGDFILDVYTKGSVDRISPEAPVPVLLVSEEGELAGGAGNVALSLEALGAHVDVVGRIGCDEAGGKLTRIFSQGLFEEKGFPTSTKNRFIAGGQQLLRVDYEQSLALSKELEGKVIKSLMREIGKYQLVAVSDYGKGFLSNAILRCIFEEAKRHGIPVIVDPKGRDFSKYAGAFLLKPNNKEAYAAAGVDSGQPIEEVAKRLFFKTDIDHLLITRSERGMILFSRDGHIEDFPVTEREVRDVTGAGDTVLSMLAFCLGNNLPLSQSIELANIAASLAIEEIGCARITLSEVAARLLERHPSYKIFSDESHLFVLEKLAQDYPITYLDLREEVDISGRTYQLIKEVAGKKGERSKLAIQVTGENKDFICLLASMHEVDFVLTTETVYDGV